jgi:hypothetical protein
VPFATKSVELACWRTSAKPENGLEAEPATSGLCVPTRWCALHGKRSIHGGRSVYGKRLRKIYNKSPDVGAGAKSIPIIRGSLGVGIGVWFLCGEYRLWWCAVPLGS